MMSSKKITSLRDLCSRNMSYVKVLLIMLLLSGCSGNLLIDEPEQALSGYQRPLSTHQIPKRELTGMLEEYQQAAESPFPQVAALARERLAGLALEQSEDELLSYSLDDVDKITDVGYYKAIGIYQQLLKDYPERIENDHIRYQLARAYDYAGEPLIVLKILTELVELHPQSSFFAEAQFRRGELLFTLSRFDEATLAYQAITDRGISEPYFQYALYKQAWSLYRSNRTSAAHHHFADLLEYLHTPGDLNDVPVGKIELVKDVLRVLAISFSQMNGAESIQQFADTRGNKPYTALIYQALSEQLETQRLYSEAADVYSFYLEHSADQPQAPLYHLKKITLLEKGGYFQQALQARKQFVERYDVNNTIWGSLSVGAINLIESALKDNITYLAKYYHSRYQGGNQLPDAEQAQRWYQYFLTRYPNADESGEIHFLYAEILYEMGEFDQAALAYESAAYDYPPHDKAAEAAYAALISYEKRKDTGTEQVQRQFISSAERFLRRFPDDSRINQVRHKKADQHLALNEYAAAIKELEPLISMLAVDSPQLGGVWYKLTFSHFMLEDYLAVESTSQQALLHIKEPKKRKEVEERLAAAIYKQGEKAEADGDLAAAAAHFLRIVATVPGASIIIQAQYDAAAALMNNSDWHAAADVLERFTASYPRHKLALGAQEKLAYSYKEMGESSKAAYAYSTLAIAERNPERKRAWLSQAADLHQQEGNIPLAINMFEQYLSLTKKEDMSYFEVNLLIANLYNKLGNTKRYRSNLEKIISKIGKNNPDIGLRQQAANATLSLADSYQKVFAVITLTTPIKKALKHKKEAMQKALDLYKQANEYRISNVTTASTYRIAELYRQFSHALMTSEKPKELAGEELEMYTMMLEEQAFPFEEKAIELHKLNTNRITAGLYDEWIKESFNALGGLEPARFNKQEVSVDLIAPLN